MWQQRVRTSFYFALAFLIPGGLWVMGLIALFNVLRRHYAQRVTPATQPLGLMADTAARRSDGYLDTVSPRPRGPAISTQF